MSDNCIRALPVSIVMPVCLLIVLLIGLPASAAEEELNLGGTFKGNREQPRVLYIVPWQQPSDTDELDRPVNGLIDNVLTPIDRDVFQRELKYFEALSEGEQQAQDSILSR